MIQYKQYERQRSQLYRGQFAAEELGVLMNKLFIILKSNIRKTWGDTVAVFVLLLISSMLLYLGITLSVDYRMNYQKEHLRMNGEHNAFVVAGIENEVDMFIEERISDNRVKNYDLCEGVALDATISYGEDSYRSLFVALKKEDAIRRAVGTFEIIEESDDHSSGVYLPYVFKTGGYYNAGDEFLLESDDKQWSFSVKGFYNSTQTSDNNAGITAILLTTDAYKQLNEAPYMKTVLLSVLLHDVKDTERYEYDFEVAASNEDRLALLAGNNYNTVFSRKYLSVIFTFSVCGIAGIIVLAITAIVIWGSIRDFISKNIKALGELKAIGYKSFQLIGTIYMQFISTCILGVALGMLLSVPVFKSFSSILVSLTGIDYRMHFYATAVIITGISMLAVIMLAIAIGTLRIWKIPPVAAIRNIADSGSVKSCNISIEDTSTPLILSLSLKEIFKNKGQSLIIFLAIIAISLGISACSLFYISSIVNTDELMELQTVLSENMFTVNKESAEEFEEYFTSNPDVKNVLMYIKPCHILCNGNQPLRAIVIDSGYNMNNREFLYEGRYPDNDKEILLGGRFAKRIGARIGDVVNMTFDDRTLEYEIVGFLQTDDNAGNDCCMITEGFEKLRSLNEKTYYVSYYDSNKAVCDREKIKKMFPDAKICDYDSVADGSMDALSKLMVILTVGLIIICMFITTFVILIFGRNLLEGNRNDFGLYKAIGFTTSQLVWQMEGTFLPIIIVGFIVGIPTMSRLCNPIFSFMTSSLGLVKIDLSFSVPLIIITALVMVIYSFLVILIFTRKIKKISPHDLMYNE